MFSYQEKFQDNLECWEVNLLLFRAFKVIVYLNIWERGEVCIISKIYLIMNLFLKEHNYYLFDETQFGNTILNNYFLIVIELDCFFKFLIVCACDQTILSKQLWHNKMKPGPKILPLYEKGKIFLFINESTLKSMPATPENLTWVQKIASNLLFN